VTARLRNEGELVVFGAPKAARPRSRRVRRTVFVYEREADRRAIAGYGFVMNTQEQIGGRRDTRADGWTDSIFDTLR